MGLYCIRNLSGGVRVRSVYSVYSGVRKIRTKADRFGTVAVASVAGLAVATVLPLAAHAAPSTVVVTPANTQGWSTADTTAGGSVTYSNDTTTPGTPNNGALELKTDSDTASRAQYMHTTTTALADVTELSYSAKQVSGPAVADPSYQLPVCLGGVAGGNCVGFTTLVYEPYWNGTVTPGAWQSWDVMSGQLWSSRTVSDPNNAACSVNAGAGGSPFYSITQLQAECPDAVVTGFGVNVGTYNTNYDVEADLVDFNGVTYNFEPYQAATDKDACKDGGWQSLSAADGSSFKNQGACVSYVASGVESLY